MFWLAEIKLPADRYPESFACFLHFAHRVGLIAHSWLAAVWVGASVEPGAGGETVEPQVQTWRLCNRQSGNVSRRQTLSQKQQQCRNLFRKSKSKGEGRKKRHQLKQWRRQQSCLLLVCCQSWHWTRFYLPIPVTTNVWHLAAATGNVTNLLSFQGYLEWKRALISHPTYPLQYWRACQ